MKPRSREDQGDSLQYSEDLEDRLKPSKILGYDRDHLGVALLRREMFEAAESQFRRAAELNPYEAGFKQHLAWCLYKMGRYEEARSVIEVAITQKPNDPDARTVLERILSKLDT